MFLFNIAVIGAQVFRRSRAGKRVNWRVVRDNTDIVVLAADKGNATLDIDEGKHREKIAVLLKDDTVARFLRAGSTRR